MNRLLASALLPLCLLASGAALSHVQPDGTGEAAWRDTVEEIATAMVAERQTPGLALGIARAGEPPLIRGYGLANLEHGAPVHEETVFRIGSVTKQFTAAAILLLAEEGRLTLDDTLDHFFPDFPRAGEVTVRHLLQHTSGISNYTSRDGFMADTAPLHHDEARMLAYLTSADPVFDFDPGTSWSYSNSGYMLLDYIAGQVAGQTLAEFLQTRIFTPLGMTATAMDNTAEIVPDRAQGYDAAPDAPSRFTNTTHLSLSVAAGAGAMRSTPGDLIIWMQALLGGEVLSAESLALMLEPARLDDGRLARTALADPPAALAGMDYGLGIMTGERGGRRFIGHGGSINGFNASLMHYPDEQTTIVLLVNTIGPAAQGAPRLAEAVFDAVTD